MGKAWSDDAIDRLKQLYADGLSFGQIAKRLFVTRNACIGKAHRLGVTSRAAAGQSRRYPRPTTSRLPPWLEPRLPKPRKPRKPLSYSGAPPPPLARRIAPAALSTPLDRPERPSSTEITAKFDPAYENCVPLLEARAWQCRWPIGDPVKFCGQRTCDRSSGSYCAYHAAIAYAPNPQHSHPRSVGFSFGFNTEGLHGGRTR